MAGRNITERAMRAIIIFTMALALGGIIAPVPAEAEVRFGNNVRIGGHDAGNQTFNRKRRGHYIIHEGKPAREGCRWVRNRDGSRTKLCNLQRRYR
jgi:hypothetical protein